MWSGCPASCQFSSLLERKGKKISHLVIFEQWEISSHLVPIAFWNYSTVWFASFPAFPLDGLYGICLFFHFDRTRKRGQDWNRLEWPRVLNDLGMSPVRCCEWGCWRCPVAPAAVAAAPCCWRRLWSAAAPTGQWRPSAAAPESEAAPSRPGISSAPPAAARPCLWPFSPERYEWGRGGGKFNPEFFFNG